MTQIEIPFSPDMAIAAIEGRKIATTRSERKGGIGDTFEIQARSDASGYPLMEFEKFRLIDIWETTLESVRDFYYHLEGFDSPEAFEKTWRALHRGHFMTDKYYFIHFFGRIA